MTLIDAKGGARRLHARDEVGVYFLRQAPSVRFRATGTTVTLRLQSVVVCELLISM
jgi:hypothetical protein